MNRLLILFISALLAISASAETGEAKKIIWSCKERLFGDENILWLVEWGEKSYIKVFDERIPADYEMDGLEKRWNWGLGSWDWGEMGSTYTYAITLGPDRIAGYYDFSTSKDGVAESREQYRCTKN